jgi:hypothetical protein
MPPCCGSRPHATSRAAALARAGRIGSQLSSLPPPPCGATATAASQPPPPAVAAAPAAASTTGAANIDGAPPVLRTFEHEVGALCGGNDAAVEDGHTLESAAARCVALGAAGFTFFCGSSGDDPPPLLPRCYFKASLVRNDDATWTRFVRRGVTTVKQPELGAAADGDAEAEAEGAAATAAVSAASGTYAPRAYITLLNREVVAPFVAAGAPAAGACQRLPVCAFECVEQRAVEAARRIVERVLEGCDAAVVARLAAAGCSVAVIGRRQVTSGAQRRCTLVSTVGRPRLLLSHPPPQPTLADNMPHCSTRARV